MVNPKLEGRQVRLRESQVKFLSADRGLNVVRCATFSQGYLNRQIIILLNALGVPEEVFLKMQ
jgi:RNA-dependent RNA polymerase